MPRQSSHGFGQPALPLRLCMGSTLVPHEIHVETCCRSSQVPPNQVATKPNTTTPTTTPAPPIPTKTTPHQAHQTTVPHTPKQHTKPTQPPPPTKNWRIRVSIPVPPACKAGDLPIDLIPQIGHRLQPDSGP